MAAYLAKGTLPALIGNRSPTRQGSADVFETSDGHISVAAIKDHQVEALLAVVARQDAFDRFSSARPRVRDADALADLLQAAFRERPTAHWLAKLDDAAVPAASVRQLDEVSADPQFRRPAHHAVSAAGLTR